MIVYAIHQKKIYNTILPKNIDGNYTLKDENEDGKERTLLNIVAKDNKWVIANNKKIDLYENGVYRSEIILEDYRSYEARFKNSNETVIIYTCPVMENTFTCFTVDTQQSIIIGNEEGSGIKYNTPLISPRHSVIGFENNRWIIKVIDARYATYINDEKVNGAAYINNGDVVFIMGLKITIVDNKMWINNPNNQVFVSGNIFKVCDIPDNNIEEEYEERADIKLYDEKDYFSRVSQFYETVETAHFILDDAPSLEKPKELPVILTIGPMLTMSMTSVSTLVMSFLNFQNNQNKNALTATIIMSVAMLAGTILWPVLTNSYQKKREQKEKNNLQERYINYLNSKDAELNRISTNQLQILMSNNISSIDAYNMAFTSNPNLWKRDIHQKDFLNIRLGIGKIPLNIDYNIPEEHFKAEDDSNLYKKLKAIIEKYENIENAPIIESLITSNIVSIIGKHELTKKYVDSLLLQILFLHSYYDLKIVLFTESQYEKEWSYLKKAPHTFDNSKDIRFFASNEDDSKEIAQYLLNIINVRMPEKDKEDVERYKSFDSYYLIITDNYEKIKDYPLFEKIFKSNSNLGFSVIIMNNNFANLPIECHKFIGINSETEGGLINSELSLDNQKVFQIEQASNVNYEAFCVALANIPILGKKSSFKLPTVYNFLEMYEAGNVEQLNSLERWRYNDPVVSLSVPIGINSIGSNFKLDLHEKVHGPHGLIAGMTGSGKSDFIISYILSMAVNFHPDEVQFVLIDYKGGGLVGAFSNKEAGYKLPHLAGTITNLEKSEIDRSMAAIQTELERRQELFNSAKEKLSEGTIDIYKYQKYYREGLIDTPLSHLFIISDEFAELKSQEPDFMDLLISTARIGRSLGVHLILATQKPSGVVNDQIWSNARFKICLKVQDANDSNEVIKRPDAAYLKEPGRFFLQVGFNEIFDIGQAAYTEASYIPKEQVHKEIDDNINFINNIGRNIKTINIQKNEQEKVEGEELTTIVKYLSNLSVKEGITGRQLWLEPLPKVMYYDDIVRNYNYKKTSDIEAVIGVYDDPTKQAQSILTLNFSKLGNAVIYSADERNTIMDTIIYSLISNYTAKEINIFGLDFDSQTLKIFQDAPQVGDILFISETEKIDRIFRNIQEEIEKRKVLFQDYNGNYDFYINNSGKQIPAIIFIIHGYENFKETFDEKPEEVEKIAREGARYGVYLIITAVSDTALRVSLRNNISQIVPLKLTSQADYNMLFGKKAPVIKDCSNRGVIARDEGVFEFQTAYISDGETRRDKIINTINKLNETANERALEIRTLPKVVTFKDVYVEQLSFNKLPIGLETSSLNVSYYDITKSLITTILSSSVEKIVDFAYVFYKMLKKFKNINIMLYDMNDFFSRYTDISQNTFEELDSVIFNPERKVITVVYITGVSKWINALDENDRKDLDDYFKRISDLKNCIFIFIDKLQDIKTITYETWFKKYVPNDKGIFIGRGIGDDTFHSINNSYSELNESIPENFGYNINNGMGTRIQIVEEIDNGE